MQSVMQHTFSQIPNVDIPRSVFDRSSGLKTAFNSGYIVPIYVDEVLPGDTVVFQPNFFARLSTQIVPLMDNLYLDLHSFYIPLRLLWDNFKKFMGEQNNPGDSIDYHVPYIDTGTNYIAEESLGDYMGLPINAPHLQFSALFFRGYNMIYNEWYKDQNLCQRATFSTGDGPDNLTSYGLKKRCKRHDYFTSALLWPQKGSPVITPLGVSAPVFGNGKGLPLSNGTDLMYLQQTVGSAYLNKATSYANTGATITLANPTVSDKVIGAVPGPMGTPANSGLYADLSLAVGPTINTLRESFAAQRMLERDARAGSRYVEIIRSHFSVDMPHMLYRPELIGSSSHRIQINPVTQTSVTPPTDTENGTPLGHLAAYGTIAGNGQGGYHKSFFEHGIIYTLASVRADLTYQQGIDRMWLRSTRLDYYWPTLAHLGEQGIYNCELYMDGTNTAMDKSIFGYQERYAEYRYKPSKITGKMRSNLVTPANSLDMWHLAQSFDSLPSLDQTFIEENVPLDRVLAVSNEPQILLDGYFDCKFARPMPTYSVPGLIDHL